MIFVLYSAVVWCAAAKWRRTWRSFVVVALGVMAIAMIMFGQERLTSLVGMRMFGPMLNALLYPYVVLLGLVGFYIAVLPRPLGEGAVRPCVHCGYDLIGMEEFREQVCPECGAEIVVRGR